MAEQQNHNEVKFLTRLAGIEIPDSRLPALAMGLGGMKATCEALARVDYGALSPASRFEVPAPR
jgi:hypothetical protein